MHTNSSERAIKHLLHSLPVEVIFAGFRGTTLSLAQAGWDLSMRQQIGYGGEYEMQLALRHGDQQNAIYALSHPLRLRHGEIYGAMQDNLRLAQFMASQVFDIQHVYRNIEFMRIPMQHSSRSGFLSDWQGVDARPQEMVATERIDIREFKFFKVANEAAKELIVHPDQVPELLDLILKAQAGSQKEIRAREKSRENLAEYRSGDMFDKGKPAHQVQAQIITLAG